MGRLGKFLGRTAWLPPPVWCGGGGGGGGSLPPIPPGRDQALFFY